MTAVDDMLARLRSSLDETIGKLEDVEEEQMLLTIPSSRASNNVRQIFYRLLGHEYEHTVQMVKALAGLGVEQTEAQLILSRIRSAQGQLQGLLVGLSDEDLDRSHAEGEWTPRQVIEHIIEVHEMYSRGILEALAEGDDS